jgi:hypothetical protein
VLPSEGRHRAGAGVLDFEDERGRRATASLLAKDQAPRMAVNFAKLASLLRQQ